MYRHILTHTKSFDKGLKVRMSEYRQNPPEPTAKQLAASELVEETKELLSEKLEEIRKLVDDIGIYGTAKISRAVDDIKDLLDDHDRQLEEILEEGY